MKSQINRSLYRIVFVLVILMLISSLPSLAMTHSVTGYSLIFHAILSPILAVGLAVMAFLNSHDFRFRDSEWQWLLQRIPRKEVGRETIRKLSFWLSLFFAVPVILSITLNMFPLFDSNAQTILISIHRSSVIGLTITLLTHISLTLYGERPKEY